MKKPYDESIFFKLSPNLTKCSRCHGLGVNGGLCICSRQVWSRVISALVIVVFNIEAGELGKTDSQGAAGIVDVLSIQRLKQI